MRNLAFSSLSLVVACFPLSLAAEESAQYLLQADLSPGDATVVSVDLEVGGDLIIRDENSKEKKLPMSVAGTLKYQEQIVAWSTDFVRSLRKYDQASATIQVDDRRVEKSLPAELHLVAADLGPGQSTINGCESPLSREQLDLINVVGNSLALDQLLPGREMAEGENWDHDGAVLGALLGMDHVAVCEVSSVIVGQSHNQVQIRIAGTVHGTIDGTTTEIDLRGAYLFHQKLGRITKFNLAIKEKRATSEVIPGLDVVAKVKIVISPAEAESPFSDALIEQTGDVSQPLRSALRYQSTEQGYQFLHSTHWFVTAEQRDLLSLRCLQDSDLTSHCNVTTQPARSAGRGTTLEQFKGDVRVSLGDNLDEVAAATQWTTSQGLDCLGVIANGKVKGVAVQWRYYLVAADGMPRVTLAVTVEQSQLERFNDADRELVDSLELFTPVVAKTATKDGGKSSR
ncbi:MAG: hypothetical protein GXP26_06855 [Planctomycetes bacterium]|nr:hypothetical protein [Planctomycetota bacterium]